ncbi:hypothetical protein [Halopiger djelfimassiliensis]|uniref:hypothetical protein n=1 Tax=Halopiger djelfimassiliensis TaxID=1293047 RepID=UPI0006779249|nr:hypothetical protein [Halopiger djelfimassiliensis]
MDTSAENVVRDYYGALRRGDPLEPYVLDGESTVKFGIGEALFGSDEIADALREQTETTADWTVESTNLVVDERSSFATFADEVTMAWTDTDTGDRRRFESRWSGTLVPSTGDSSGRVSDDSRREWVFASLHVSAPREL